MSIFTRSAEQIKESIHFGKIQTLAEDFSHMINTWDRLPEMYDRNLEIYWHKSILAKLESEKEDFQYPTFVPSSAGSCPRELYHRMTGDPADSEEEQPHQNRWKQIGNSVTELIQKKLLYIMKHYKDRTKQDPVLIPHFIEADQNSYGITKYPAWEDFVKTQKFFTRNGKKIPLLGKPDGILIDQEGNKIILEIKSKQTSYTRTGHFSMKRIEDKHIEQLKGYSLLYGINDFIVIYVNTSHKGWSLDQEESLKYPDIRTFGYHVTDVEQEELLNYFSMILDHVEKKEPPFPDFSKWTFNNYKESIMDSFTMDEVHQLCHLINQEKQQQKPDKEKLKCMEKFMHNLYDREILHEDPWL